MIGVNAYKHTYIGWEYYHISNAMQYSNTALENTSLVMYNLCDALFLMALQIS